jgi:hypothetical protein
MEVCGMFECEKCGRKFKSAQALGGHVRSAHKAPKESNEKGTDKEAGGELTGEEQEPSSAEETSEAEQIREYLKEGYTLEQLKTNFGFKESTIRQEIKKMVPPEGTDLLMKADSSDDGLPVMRKTGGGAEITTPEAILKYYMTGGETEKYELRGMMKLRAAMLMVMDLVNIQKSAAEADAKRLEPIFHLMQETRLEQDAAAARAKASSLEIAKEAAQEAVGGVLGYIEEKIPKGPPPKTVDEAYAKRIDKVMDMMWGVMEQQMFPGKQGDGVPEGWETEQKKGEI